MSRLQEPRFSTPRQDDLLVFNAKRQRSGKPEWDGQQFAFDDPRVPLPIRQQVIRLAEADWVLCFADTKDGGEWWLLDDAGELIEAFWLV